MSNSLVHQYTKDKNRPWAAPMSVGRNKIADLVKQAFQSVKGNLKDIQIFHTDRGYEFKNQTIDETLKAFEIQRSLSHKGCPYDNAVAEATFKIIKTEFVRNQTFNSLCDQLKYIKREPPKGEKVDRHGDD